MPILVSDTSVIIDLYRAQLLEEMFHLPHEFVVPDLLYARELNDGLGDRLRKRGLRVEALDSGEVTKATALRRARTRLSVPDAFAYVLAQSRGWTLLTGDGELRTLAQEEEIEMHGVLWILDHLFEGGHVENTRLHAGLSNLQSHPRCRLPANEIGKRLKQYAV